PPPTCIRPARWTLAALSMASVASITPTSPLVSIKPSASPLSALLCPPIRWLVRGNVAMVSGSVALGILGGRGRLGRLGESQHAAQVFVGPGNHRAAHDSADPAGGGRPGVNRRFHGRHVAGHE